MEFSGIEWTDHTFNPWIGCSKVSEACAHCYAVRLASRLGVTWGDHAERKPASNEMWGKVERWHREAQANRSALRVFCASMADVNDVNGPAELKARLWSLAESTNALQWLMLSKRPERYAIEFPPRWMQEGVPSHIWIGATAENQRWAEERVSHLRAIPSQVRFLSVEPLLERVDLTHLLLPPGGAPGMPRQLGDGGIHWVIVGGESGPGSRPMHPAWVRDVVQACRRTGTACFFKQWGEYLPIEVTATGTGIRHSPAFPPLEGVVQMKRWDGENAYPVESQAEYSDLIMTPGSVISLKIGKKMAGHRLDGMELRDFPRDRSLA